MKFRIISVDYLSKYDDDFRFKNMHHGKEPYYVVQYKKDPSFFGLIKPDWKSVYYNAEELAKKFDFTVIALESVGSIYDEKDILVPNMHYAKHLLSLVKRKFGYDPVASKFKVVLQEEDEIKDPNSLADKYTDLIDED